jgi:iron complex transport system permease protein
MIFLSKPEKKVLIHPLFLAILPVAVFFISFSIGRYPVSIPQALTILFSRLFNLSVVKTWPSTVETVLFKVRIPRILCALMIGASLAGSGATYQGIFKNPMVSPDILGAAAGAGFGAAAAILLSFNVAGIELMSFLFGLAAVLITYLIGNLIGKKSGGILVLVLTGMVVQSLFSAFTSMTKYVADPDNKLPEITFWLMGGLSSITTKEVWMLFVPFILGIIPLFLFRWQINVLSFGEEEARALGVNTGRVRMILIFASTLLTSSSVAVAGMVGWVGLIIPHLARLVAGPNYKRLLPASLLIGSTFMVVVDDAARTLFTLEIPLGILTAIIGAPFFLFLLVKGRRQWI